MLRFILGFIGAVFAAVLLISFFSNLATYFRNPPAPLASEEFHREPKEVRFASDGPFGKFDKRQLQRGFQVYSEVCSACHSLKMVSFRDLKALGYNDAEIKKIAADWKTQVPSINPDTGEPATRKALPSDTFPSPFANEVAARAANNNALPPDLSLIAKAREGGAAYIYSLLTGFRGPPRGYQVPPNLHYNPWFANLNIAMPPPLTADGQVTYAPGNPPATRAQMAHDVAAFLMWAAEPNLQARHQYGLAALIFLILGMILAYLAYQEVWHGPADRRVRATGPLDPENMAKSDAASREAGIAL